MPRGVDAFPATGDIFHCAPTMRNTIVIKRRSSAILARLSNKSGRQSIPDL
jgi:hypothetical protein